MTIRELQRETGREPRGGPLRREPRHRAREADGFVGERLLPGTRCDPHERVVVEGAQRGAHAVEHGFGHRAAIGGSGGSGGGVVARGIDEIEKEGVRRRERTGNDIGHCCFYPVGKRRDLCSRRMT
ncbi:hypothetical protein [Paraburkholderia acidisoli]|uniref:hypothetical protein n=1 Tax=Paraburkholderia acidisoli TaxID=2571748 RepID=UPI002D7E8695|nr:hypothetical protein [Paraburkholderia acidisoli]